MPLPPVYPGAIQLLNGVGPGAWNGSGPWKLLLHTTETKGLPGYSQGKVAPHITWGPNSGKFWQHFRFDRPSEALSTFDDDMVIQVEMICYSAKWIADSLTPPGLWVGALTDSHLAQLAGFCRWVMAGLSIPDVWPKRQAFSAGVANAPGFRYSPEVFRAYGGVLGHQHAPYPNDHWDPGAFPWHRFMPLVAPDPVPSDEMATKERVLGLQADPTRIDRLVENGLVKPNTTATKTYWRNKLANPDDPEWHNFFSAVDTETAIRSGSTGPLTVNLTGTAKP